MDAGMEAAMDAFGSMDAAKKAEAEGYETAHCFHEAAVKTCLDDGYFVYCRSGGVWVMARRPK